MQTGSNSSIVHNFRVITPFKTAHLQITLRIKPAFSDVQIRFIIIQYCSVESRTAVNVFFVQNTELMFGIQLFINLKISCELGGSFRYTHCLLQHPGDQKNLQ